MTLIHNRRIISLIVLDVWILDEFCNFELSFLFTECVMQNHFSTAQPIVRKYFPGRCMWDSSVNLDMRTLVFEGSRRLFIRNDTHVLICS